MITLLLAFYKDIFLYNTRWFVHELFSFAKIIKWDPVSIGGIIMLFIFITPIILIYELIAFILAFILITLVCIIGYLLSIGKPKQFKVEFVEGIIKGFSDIYKNFVDII